MKKVYLSDAGPKVSPAIYGFWRWEKDASQMEQIVHLCLELGIHSIMQIATEITRAKRALARYFPKAPSSVPISFYFPNAA